MGDITGMDTEVLEEVLELRALTQQATARIQENERSRPLPDGTRVP